MLSSSEESEEEKGLESKTLSSNESRGFTYRMLGDPNTMILGGSDGYINVVDMKKLEIVLKRGIIREGSKYYSWFGDVKIFKKESAFISTGEGDLIYLPKLSREDIPPKILKCHSHRITDILFVNSEKLITSSWDKSIALWDIEKLEVESRMEEVHSRNIWGLDIDRSRNWLVSTSYDNLIKIHDLQQFKTAFVINNTTSVDCSSGCIYDCCIDPKSGLLYISADLRVMVYSLKDLSTRSKPVMNISGGSCTGGLSCLHNPEKQVIATGNYSGKIRFDDVRMPGKVVKVLDTPGRSNIYRLSNFSYDARSTHYYQDGDDEVCDSRNLFVSSGNKTCIVDFEKMEIVESFTFPKPLPKQNNVGDDNSNSDNPPPYSIGLWNCKGRKSSCVDGSIRNMFLFSSLHHDPIVLNDRKDRVDFIVEMLVEEEEGWGDLKIKISVGVSGMKKEIFVFFKSLLFVSQ